MMEVTYLLQNQSFDLRPNMSQVIKMSEGAARSFYFAGNHKCVQNFFSNYNTVGVLGTRAHKRGGYTRGPLQEHSLLLSVLLKANDT